VDEGDSAVTDLTDEELGLLLPGLAALISQASQEQGLDLSVDADGLRKILAYAAGGRVHGDHAPPEVPPSPVAVKSLLSSPFRHRAKAIRPVQIQRRGGRSYTAHYDDVARKWVKKPAGQTLPDAPTVPPVPEKKVPAWSELKDQYRNPGQWVESAFATEEARDRARATPQYRAMVEAWADDKGRQWAAGDPRQDKEPAKAPSGPGAPGWVDVPLTVTGGAADEHLQRVLSATFTTDRHERSGTSGQKMSYAKSYHRVLRNMPRRARDLLADGLAEVRTAGDSYDLTRRAFDDCPEMIAGLSPEALTGTFITAVNKLDLSAFPDEITKQMREMVSDGGASLVKLLREQPDSKGAAGVRKLATMYAQELKKKIHGKAGGIYVPTSKRIYADGPTHTVFRWLRRLDDDVIGTVKRSVREALRPTEEAGYGMWSGDSQTDNFSHELTHAIDHDTRFSRTHDWEVAWLDDLGGDPSGGLADTLREDLPLGRKYPLTVYAATHPAEGFAEVGRLIYSGDCDLTEFRKRFPKVAAFFTSNGLWPEEIPDGKNTGLDDVFLGRMPFLGETSHIDLLASAWKEVKAIFRGRDRR
jgi:hypothetical protein